MSNKTKSAEDMIKGWLLDNGCNGLANSESECGCGSDDLAPCGYIDLTDCKAARLVPCDYEPDPDNPDDQEECEHGPDCKGHYQIEVVE